MHETTFTLFYTINSSPLNNGSKYISRCLISKLAMVFIETKQTKHFNGVFDRRHINKLSLKTYILASYNIEAIYHNQSIKHKNMQHGFNKNNPSGCIKIREKSIFIVNKYSVGIGISKYQIVQDSCLNILCLQRMHSFEYRKSLRYLWNTYGETPEDRDTTIKK